MSCHLTCMAGGKQSGGQGGKSSLGCIAQKWDIFTLHVPCGWGFSTRSPRRPPKSDRRAGSRIRHGAPTPDQIALPTTVRRFLVCPREVTHGASCETPAYRQTREIQLPGVMAQERTVTVIKPMAINKMRQNTLLWCILNICRRLPHVVYTVACRPHQRSSTPNPIPSAGFQKPGEAEIQIKYR